MRVPCQGVAPEACAATRPGNGCASTGRRHRKARISSQMQQDDARRTRGWGLGRGAACDPMPATHVRRYRMRDRRSWSRTEASACSACIALLHLRWIPFYAAAPQPRDASLRGSLPKIRRTPQCFRSLVVAEGTAPSSSVAPPRLVVVTRAHRPGEPNPQDSSAPIEANTRQSGHNQTRSSAWNAPTWPSPGHHGDDTNILRLVDRRRLLAGGDDRQRPRIVRGRGHLRAISASTGHGCGKYSLPN